MKPRSYACHSKDKNVLSISSSGGVYYHLALEIIKSNGIVYAACYEETKVYHKRIERKEELPQTCGSKYVCSQLLDTFRLIKKDLSDGKSVLFVGTPCQCYGLKSFIGNNTKLITIDFICHGIPSTRVWNNYVRSMSGSNRHVTSINMRDKNTGWDNYSFSMSFSDGTSYSVPHLECSYIRGMLNDLYLRPSCYECHFKGIDRVTDITLGDLWNVKELYPDLYYKDGVSFITIHSEEGGRLFNTIKDFIFYAPVDTKSCALSNTCMIESVPKTAKREKFFSMYTDETSLELIVYKLTKKMLVNKIIDRVSRLARCK